MSHTTEASRLTAQQRQRIRESREPISILVERYGVSRGAISKIRTSGIPARDRKELAEAEEQARARKLPVRHYKPCWG